jgi:putative tryptophan/tyrosine transport system substrate-binding protein
MDRRESRLSRRAFVGGAGATGLGIVAGCGRLPWQAEPTPKVPRIGYLTGELATTQVARRVALVQDLAALGHVEGQNIVIEYRYAEGQAERYDALAAELVNLPVDVLVARGSRSTQAAQQATSTIPIVMAATGDPVEIGAVASLAHPGANVTGLSTLLPQLSGKRLELLAQVVPSGSPIAILGDLSAPEVSARADHTRAAAQLLGVEIHPLAVREPSDLTRAFEAAIRERAGALIVLHNGFTLLHRAEIVELAAQTSLPAMYENNEWTQAGGLMAYGANTENMDRRVAYYVDRLLRGAKPADLPVEQPMRFDFVVNMRTAQALGLTFPNEILLQVTEVIQ